MKRLMLLALASGLLLSGCSSTTHEMKYKEPDESMKGAIQHTQGTTEAPGIEETSAESIEETSEAVEVPEVLGGSGMSDTAVLNLYNKGVDKTSNWCFSPYSLLDCMSIIAMDVQGDTKAEYDMLGASDWQFFADYDEKLPEGLSISNRAYINENMKDATNTDFVRPGCDIHVLQFDDAALQLINDNVSNDTNGKISRIFESLDSGKPSCFVNAVYFNNKWDWEAKDVTWKDDSELRPGFGDDIGVDCVKELSPEIDMVRLEYPGTDFAMYVMCPNHEVEDLTSEDLDSFMENDFSFDMLTPNTEDLWDEASFRMPSFEFSAQPEVQEALMGIGVKSIFGDTADFGQLGRLYIGSIIQKTYVKVNNKGTEAAAVTGVMMDAMSAQPMEVRRKSVIVNQDFVFVIKDEAKDVVLFMGRVTDPVGENESSEDKSLSFNDDSDIFSIKQETPLGGGQVSKKLLDSDQFKSAVESIGMDFSRIKGVSALPDWASGKRYSFIYGGSPYIVYELGNGEVDTITTDNNKRFKIYERGYKPLDYRNFELDWGTVGLLQSDMMERLSKYIIGATSVKNKIGSISYSRAYNYYSLSGEVKAKNAVNKKDFTFTVDYMLKDNSYECVYLALDGAVAFGSGESPELPKEEIVQEDKSGGDVIVLSYGKEGQYGQTDSFGGDSYIRYYIPAGSYRVKCNIRGGFYVETIALHKEEGYDISDIIQDVRVSEGDEVDIVVGDGECISLIINTEIELTKK